MRSCGSRRACRRSFTSQLPGEPFSNTSRGRSRFSRTAPCASHKPIHSPTGAHQVSIFIGSNAGETIEPGFVSPTVVVIGNPKTPGAGTDIILAGSGDDRVAGGGGNDIAFLGAGNDLYTWNSGDGNDLVDGGSGSDTLAFNGSAGAETIKLSTGILGTTRVSSSADNGGVTLTGVEHIVVSAGDGDDIVDASGLPAGRASLEIIGGRGNDLLIGSAGNDAFVWNPGDGSDTIEGGAGSDTMLFNGANIAEEISVQANGQRVLFTRNIATITMDLNHVERIDFTARGGADLVRVHDLTGTDVKEVNVDLAATPGSGTGDGAVDQVIVDGTNGNDTLQFTGSGASASVLGLAATTTVLNAETTDQLIVNGLAGNDVLSASVAQAGAPALVFEGGDGQDTALGEGSSGADAFAIAAHGTRAHVDAGNLHLDVGTTESLVISGGAGDDDFSAVGNLAALTNLTLDGGAGNDTIRGGNGADLLIGGDGNDFIDGNQGNDTAQMGAGDDTFQWDPGDGSDIVEGGDGSDTMLFNGANIAEVMDVSANGSRTLFTRNIGTITMDLNDVERIDVNALGGADVITVHDMRGTDVTQVNVNLGAVGGAGDGAADQVIVEATSGNDSVEVAGSGNSNTVLGLAAATTVTNSDTGDQLIINGLAGNDMLSMSATQAGQVPVVFEGGDGNDTALVHGGDGADSFAIAANGTRAHVDAGNLHLDVGTTESLVISGGAGDDEFSAVGNLAALTNLTLDGGAGNDTIRGGNGADLLIGGDGNDFIDGNQGNDTAQMGAGDDTFQWDPGDGSDIVEGQAGFDTMLFNGANIAEVMDVSANGSRTLFTRNIGNITMDLNDVERIDVRTLGGADAVVVHDLSGTDVHEVNVDLSATGGAGDGEVDSVTALATEGNDHLQFTGGGTTASVLGLAAITNVSNAEVTDQFIVDGLGGDDVLSASLDQAGAPTLVFEGGDGNDTAQVQGSDGADTFTLAANGTHARVDAGNLHLDVGTTEALVIDAGDGDDSISAVGNLAPLTKLTLDGGAGDDTIRGGNGADLLIGGDCNDFIDGNQGNDTALMGAGDDTFQWDPGDGSDIVEGQAGFDTMLFNGANIAEEATVSANGERALFTRNIANITMDLNDVERIDFNPLGGADKVTVNDLSATDVTEVNVALAGTLGGATGDGAADQVIVNGTAGDDVAVIAGDAGGLSVLGLAARVNITGAEGTLDQLHVNGGAGDDVIDASGVAAGSIGLVLDGGEGNDIILGSAGDDVLIGGPGDDVIIGGGGNDTIIAAPGADTVIQGFAAGAGSDDVIDLRGIAGAQDFAWVMAHASDVDGNAVLDLGGEHVTIENVAVASLHSDDFLLGS